MAAVLRAFVRNYNSHQQTSLVPNIFRGSVQADHTYRKPRAWDWRDLLKGGWNLTVFFPGSGSRARSSWKYCIMHHIG